MCSRTERKGSSILRFGRFECRAASEAAVAITGVSHAVSRSAVAGVMNCKDQSMANVHGRCEMKEESGRLRYVHAGRIMQLKTWTHEGNPELISIGVMKRDARSR